MASPAGFLPTDLDPARLPQHVAIIMDGNGRWAMQKGGRRIFGHREAITAVRDTIEGAAEIGIRYLTLYAFSTENWNRPRLEVDALMQLLVETLNKETATLERNRIRLHTIGATETLPADCQRGLREAMRRTAAGDRMTLSLALSYGSRADIVNAIRRIAAAVQLGELHTENIDQETLRRYLTTADLPDPELVIRTSGEFRLSNFLLWEVAYSELYVSPKLWPDFRRADLHEALRDYQRRERRFGKTSEQIKSNS